MMRRSLYYESFHSHLSYVCTVWGQGITENFRVSILKRKAARIISFENLNAHSNPPFYKLKITKDVELISVEESNFVNKYFS